MWRRDDRPSRCCFWTSAEHHTKTLTLQVCQNSLAVSSLFLEGSCSFPMLSETFHTFPSTRWSALEQSSNNPSSPHSSRSCLLDTSRRCHSVNIMDTYTELVSCSKPKLFFFRQRRKSTLEAYNQLQTPTKTPTLFHSTSSQLQSQL